MSKILLDLEGTDKFRELVLYVSQKCETDLRFSTTKLNKILFYADFMHFSRTGKSITGQKYQKLNFGPAPRGMMPVVESMVSEAELKIAPRDYFGRSQKKPIALRSPKIEVFSSSEIAIVDEVIEAVWELTASQISSLSHGFVGWQVADLGETIPYGLAWIDDEGEFELTPEEIELIQSLQPLTDEQKSS